MWMDGLPYCNSHNITSIVTSITFMLLASTVVAKRGSRAVFGNMPILLTVKTTNSRFFVLFTVVVFTKNICLLY